VDWLNGFIITILCTVLLTALCNALMPEGNLAKYANMILGLVVTVIVLGSIIGIRNIDFDMLFNIDLPRPDMQSGTALYAENIADTFCINLAENIQTRIMQEFACEIDAVVSVTVDEQGNINGIDTISVNIPPYADSDAIISFIAQTYGADNVTNM